jgi:hypothetical protein
MKTRKRVGIERVLLNSYHRFSESRTLMSGCVMLVILTLPDLNAFAWTSFNICRSFTSLNNAFPRPKIKGLTKNRTSSIKPIFIRPETSVAPPTAYISPYLTAASVFGFLPHLERSVCSSNRPDPTSWTGQYEASCRQSTRSRSRPSKRPCP